MWKSVNWTPLLCESPQVQGLDLSAKGRCICEPEVVGNDDYEIRLPPFIVASHMGRLSWEIYTSTIKEQPFFFLTAFNCFSHHYPSSVLTYKQKLEKYRPSSIQLVSHGFQYVEFFFATQTSPFRDPEEELRSNTDYPGAAQDRRWPRQPLHCSSG